MDINSIKLIIWDLDNTFWDGTISEQDVKCIKDNIQFISDTIDMGIVHSICSKNDFNVAKNELVSLDMWDKFVFPSINWESKGQRVKAIIEAMSLRPVNVLFIDDNLQNLNEAKYYCNDIQVLTPDQLHGIYDQAAHAAKNDKNHKRLKQYKLLENKFNAKTSFSSNTEFLYSCNICVEIINNCLPEIDRIYELIQRSNQLNFTKLRSSKEELEAIICDNDIFCGYIKVRDKFGDYGIVGFFAVKNHKAIHFVFSCRTLGMGIEQYVYSKLNCPHIETVGDVVADLNNTSVPGWINQKAVLEQKNKLVLKNSVLIKGPCDMSQMFSFIHDSENIETEFTYVAQNGVSVEGHNHTAQIYTIFSASDDQKNNITNDCSWFDRKMLTCAMQNKTFDYLILSMFTDANLGVYRRKATGEYVALCEGYYDLTDAKNWDDYINKNIFCSNIDFTEEDLKTFSEKYEYVNNDSGDITISCLTHLYEKIKNTTKIILILPSENEFISSNSPSYKDRHLKHRVINGKIRSWSADKSGVELISIDSFIKSDKDYLDTINHFSKRVYYDLANKIISLTADMDTSLKTKGKISLYLSIAESSAKKFIKKILSKVGAI